MNKIKEYFETKAISNSLLGLMWNPRWVKLKAENPELEDSDTTYFRIGSALDCLLTSPERWEHDFKVIDVNRPYGLMGKFVDNLPGGLHAFSEDSAYQEAYDKSGYKMAMYKVIAKFWENEDARGYYEAIRGTGEDVVVLSKDEYESVAKAKELIEVNEFTKVYFRKSDELIEVLHQVPIYFQYMDESCKALLDGIYIDHLERTIQPFDLKTTRSVYDFGSSYLQYGYYRQCAFYELALYSENSPVKKYIDLGYKVLDFIFIVVENKLSSSHPAIIYETNVADRLVGLKGGYVKQKYYKGVNQLIEEYKFHRDTDYWDLSMELLQNKGRIKLNIFNND